MTTRIDNKPKALLLEGQSDKLYQDYEGVGNNTFAHLKGCKNITFRNVNIKGGGLADTRYAYGFKVGTAVGPGEPAPFACEDIFFDRVAVRGFGPPSKKYTDFNRDSITVERGCAGVYLRNCILDGATDGVMDMKVGFAAKDTLFRDAAKLIRAWKGAEVLLENCTLEITHLEWKFFWIQDNSVRIVAHNCRFLLNGVSVDPRAFMMCEDQPGETQMLQIVDYNPLPDMPFFTESVPPANLPPLSTTPPATPGSDTTPPPAPAQTFPENGVNLSAGATLSGKIFLQPNLSVFKDVKQVLYFHDGKQKYKQTSAPFIMGGKAGFDTKRMKNGAHKIGVRVEFKTGAPVSRDFNITISNPKK